MNSPTRQKSALHWSSQLITAAAGISLLGGVALTHSSCGYSLQRSNSPHLARRGIRKVYVAPVVNNTYKAGVENLVYNALLKAIASGGGVRLVSDKDEADAILTGTVTTAQYALASSTSAKDLNPKNTGPSDRQVATLYQASLGCAFALERTRLPKPPKKLPAGVTPESAADFAKHIWSSSFGRSKNFSANTQLGVLGTTAALINDSEFDRALHDLAESMMGDVHESMTALF